MRIILISTKDDMKMKYTLEEHLRHVSKNHDTNHSLESVYDLQKRKLTRYLSSVVTTYPTYSTHDTWHAANIVSAIENILGKERIRKLTGIDTFLILMCAYMHDIGMLYTEQEVRELWQTKEFQSFLIDYQSDSSPIGKAAKLLLDAEEKLKEEVAWQLDIKQAITVVLMEYFRPQHGKRIQKLTDKANQIGELLCVEDSFLPSRIIKIINKIAMAHTGSFENMLDELVMVDSFAGEDFHPRLVAWLLRIGDLCDLDNDRFNKIGIATFGTLQDDNLAHYFKHSSVETLYISNDKIQIIANIDRKMLEQECASEWMKGDACENTEEFSRRCMNVYQQTIREHVNWKSWMESEINSAKLNVNKIFPKHWNRKIPEIEYKILLGGKEISSGNQNLRFLFSQEKAYSLIENISIYQNKGLIFLRELIQNAIDASKIQIWREIKEKIPQYKYEVSPFQVERMFPGIFARYMIRICLKYHEATDCVDFSIEDSGIGISVQEFQEHILKTGNSWRNREKYKKEFENMPKWLRPTGAFGIGLHTVFTVTDEMKIYTKSDQEEQTNEMMLYSGKKSGYAFCQSAEEERARGTKISFSFQLNDAQKEQCFRKTDSSYLSEYESEYEVVAIDHIKEYCRTPIVPISFNEERILDGLVSSKECNELKYFNGGEVEGDIATDNRFEYCFGDDFKTIIIYDKRNNYLVRFRITSYDRFKQRCGISFMGMHVEDNVEIEENILRLDYVDILSGDGSDVIDAARMTLTYDAKVKIQLDIEEVIVFAKGCYLKLMEEQRQNSHVKTYREEMRSLAHDYYVEKKMVDDVWQEVCQKKPMFFPAPDTLQVESSNDRVLLYLMCLSFVDEVLKIDIQELRKGMEKKNIKAFEFLDYLLTKWKGDWEIRRKFFSKRNISNITLEILEHYCYIWAHIILQFLLGKQNIRRDDERWKASITTAFNSMFPTVSKWKTTEDILKKVLEIILLFRKKADRHEYIDRDLNIDIDLDLDIDREYMITFVLKHVLFSGVAIVFEQGDNLSRYVENTMMTLEMAQPYLWIVLDIPRNRSISRLEREVWDLYVRDSIYGMFRYDMVSPDAVEKILDEKYVLSTLDNRGLTYAGIPVLKNYEVTSLEKNNHSLNVRLEPVDTGKHGIHATETGKWEIYKRFWIWIDGKNKPASDKSYVKIPGFDEYSEIVEFYTEYNPWLDMKCRYAAIPAWDYLGDIKSFMDYCNTNAWDASRCLQEIIDRDSDRKVIDYLCRTKTNGSVEDRKRIEELYRKLLLELFTVWDKEIRSS